MEGFHKMGIDHAMLCLKSFVLSAVLFSRYSSGNNLINNYLDVVTGTALPYEMRALGFDPLSLSNFTVDFDDRIKIFGKVHGSVKYTEGLLTGLSNAKRKSECSGPHYGYGLPFMNCSLETDRLTVSYKGSLKYGKLPSVSIYAESVMEPNVLEFGISYYPMDINHLRSFAFQKLGDVRVAFTGLGTPFNKYLDVLTNDFLERIWPVFYNSIGKHFQYALGRALEKVPFSWY